MYRSPADAPDTDWQHRHRPSTGSLSETPRSGVPFAAPSSSSGCRAAQRRTVPGLYAPRPSAGGRDHGTRHSASTPAPAAGSCMASATDGCPRCGAISGTAGRSARSLRYRTYSPPAAHSIVSPGRAGETVPIVRSFCKFLSSSPARTASTLDCMNACARPGVQRQSVSYQRFHQTHSWSLA